MSPGRVPQAPTSIPVRTPSTMGDEDCLSPGGMGTERSGEGRPLSSVRQMGDEDCLSPGGMGTERSGEGRPFRPATR